MAAHVTHHRVRFHELDSYDHVNHAMYVTYFEIGRVDALDAVGLSLAKLKSDGFQLVVTKIDVRFRRAATAGDDLEIRTGVSSFGRASTVWTQEILHKGTSEVVATAEVTAAVTNASGKPTRPPAEMFETLGQIAV